jgi:hypothetical protein
MSPDHESSDPVAGPRPERPEGLPEQFWDHETATVRADALAQAYRELEQKVGSMLPIPGPEDQAARDRLLQVLGRPGHPEDYKVFSPHPLLQPDPELHERLHAAGFTQKQVELVYELAAEHLIPTLQAGLSDIGAEHDRQRLEQRFGGSSAWREAARQMRTWAEANLPAEVSGTLAASYEGVLALHQMMQAGEPRLIGASTSPATLSEAELTEMMRKPRYWRDRDPDLVAQVTAGFRRLYPD